MRRFLGMGLMAVLTLALIIQLVPYGHAHSNPAANQEPTWGSAATRAYAVRACFDCHSDRTKWPWYSNVAPISWLIQHDVEDGRSALNFSDWSHSEHNTGDAVEAIRRGDMPPWYYGVLHPDAKLSASEKRAFEAGLARTH